MNAVRPLAWAAFVIVCIVWGTTYLGIRIAVETIPPLSLVAIRFVTAGVIMLAFARFRGERIPTDARTLFNLGVVGFLMVGVGNLAVVWAEQWVPSGLAALFVATAPIWMAIIEMLHGNGDRPDFRTTVGMVIGFAGVALLVTPKGSAGAFDMHFVLGVLSMQLGSIGWNIGSVRSKYYLKNVPLLASAAMQMLLGGVIVAVVAVAIGEPARFRVNPRTLGALAYLTLFGSIIAYSAYVYALAHMRTVQMSLYAYVNPVIAVIVGWLVLREQLTWVSVIAMAVILGGVAMVQSANMTKRRVVVATADIEENAA